MKSKLGFLLVGVVFGFFFRSYWFQERVEVPPANNPVEAEVRVPPPEKEQAKQRVVELRPQRVENQSPTKQEAVKPIARAAPEADMVRPEPETIHGLVINEENVAEMERHRGLLRNYAFTTQTPEGWKIQILPDDKVFLKAGLTSGDLITFEGVDKQLQMPDRAQLTSRLVTILNSIQR